MNSIKEHIPIYKQFVLCLKSGLNLLDESSRDEIRQFVTSHQGESGGFVDRGNRGDLYYSLFGFWLASAFELKSELDKLKGFVSGQTEEISPIDRFSKVLIQEGLAQPKKNFWRFFKELVVSDHPVNFSYQLFLFLLIFDARYGKKRWLSFLLRLLLTIYRPPVGGPCSLLAALLVARNEVGLKTDRMQKQLLAYYNNDGGFKAFEQMERADMLSTGVALFALQKTDFDKRLIAAPCLEFIQQNFDTGAFLSGDGDATRDLEYTFYGLLALGSLVE